MSMEQRRQQQESAAAFMLVGWAMAVAAIAWWSPALGLFVAGVSVFVHGVVQFRNA